MLPAGLLAIIAFGMVLAYVLPQRIKERSDYALVRTEDRYSAEMRVVKTTAERVERPVSRASTDAESPLLVTGAARASIAKLGADQMSRPAGPIDKAATAAQRQQVAMRTDRAAALAERRARARRRGRVAATVAALALVSWIFVGLGAIHPVVGALVTAVLAGVLVQSARVAAAQRQVDARLAKVAREVNAAATATQALRTVTRQRAQGLESAPSELATQAIRIITAADLAPLAAPALVAPVIESHGAGKAADGIAGGARGAALVSGGGVAGAGPTGADSGGADSAGWSPRDMPAPAYTLKSEVRQGQARPLADADIAAASYRAVESTSLAGETVAAPSPAAGKPAAASDSLEDILARRGSRTA